MQNPPAKHDMLLLLVALVQALLWLGLYDGLIKNDLWPAGSMAWRFCLFTAVFTGPTLLLLALEPRGRGRVFALVSTFTALVAGLGYYAGSQVAPAPYDYFHEIAPLFTVLLAVAAFKALMYVQHFAGDRPFSYSELFRRSWRNFLIFALAMLFVGVFRGILFLWQALFDAIGIGFFKELFERSWFINPVLIAAFGVGVVILRRQSGVIDTVAAIQQALMRLLLPLLAVVSLSFLLALPFTGLAPLWESGGSVIVLWMLLLTLFFVNAVYKDDPSLVVYPIPVHRLVYAGVALLPVYSAISCYGLSLRVMQYGWSVPRGLAFLLWGLLTSFALAYCYAVLRRGDGWLRHKDWINVRMGLVVMAAVLLVNSPLLDFRQISVDSQMARLRADGWRSEEFSSVTISYLSRQGRPGVDALRELRESIRDINPEIADKTIKALDEHRAHAERNHARRRDARGSADLDRRHKERVARIMRDLGLGTDDGAYPRSLAEAVAEEVNAHALHVLMDSEFHLIPADLDADGDAEYLLVEKDTGYYDTRSLSYTVFYRDPSEDGWRTQTWTDEGAGPDTLERLLQGEFAIAPQRWSRIEAGDAIIRPYH